MEDKSQLTFFYNNQQKNDKKISFDLDKIIILAIILVCLLIAAYIWGKRSSKNQNQIAAAKNEIPLVDLQAGLNETASPHPATLPDGLNKQQLITQETLEQKESQQPTTNILPRTNQLDAKKAYYTIQIASYTSASMAEKERKILAEKGILAFVNTKKTYIVLYAGKFMERKDAESLLRKMRLKYKDCLIRRIEP